MVNINPKAWSKLGVPDRPVQSIYLHVPFCAVKCHYCAFYSKQPDKELLRRYADSLSQEIRLLSEFAHPQTLFFGGGTPSILPVGHLEQIFDTIKSSGWASPAEWTVECNPATLNNEKIQLFKQFGVNRISMGVQSMDPEILERLGRIHSVDMVIQSYEKLRDAGFKNINLDLMFGIPGQTPKIWEKTLDEILKLRSEHLSCYELIYEEDTPLFESLKSGEYEIDDHMCEVMYEMLISKLKDFGFYQYEIANFARNHTHEDKNSQKASNTILPSYYSRHNMNYWMGGAYLGLGPSANGFVNNLRYQNVANTARYCELMESGSNPIEWVEDLPSKARAGEIAAFGFRTRRGWDLDDFFNRTGHRLEIEWKDELETLHQKNWIESFEKVVRPTELGLRFADAIAEGFIE